MSTSTPEHTIPDRGETFNEAQRFPDEVTLRPTLRLTQHRQRNQMPTYHLNNGFSKESRYLALMTYDECVGSAILRADVESGDLTVVDRTYPGDPAHFTEGNDMAICMEAGTTRSSPTTWRPSRSGSCWRTWSPAITTAIQRGRRTATRS